ncbi:odorant receptor 43a [Solenopsis invicta]|uniref:odorant receptor 43a n=1 Tax=Solenopsis invicta TaxID=13686 RepID=UPI00193E68DE|nr:odorant receptor 43a [Solenopsis invicta]
MDIKESSGYKDFVWAVEMHRLGLEIIGLWPKNDRMKSLWSRLHAGIILILLIFVSNVPMIFAIMHAWSDMVLVIDILHITLPLLTVPVKYIIMRTKRKVFLSIVDMMAEDWMAFKSNKERSVMIKRARTARLVVIIGYIFSIIAMSTVIIFPSFGIQVIHISNLTENQKPLPLEAYHFYDTNKSPQFELTYFLHSITIFFATIIYMSVDIFLLLVTLHICGQLENFKCRLVNLVSCTNFSKALNDVVSSHLRLIRFADNIENMYCAMMLIMVLHFGIVFCLSGFLFTLLLTNRKMNKTILAQVYYSIILLIMLLANTFIYCFAGELIMEECDGVYRATCDLEWYKLKARKARNIILLMIRLNHPLQITAGKIIPLTMATFCSIIKTSSGYISFLLTKHS